MLYDKSATMTVGTSPCDLFAEFPYLQFPETPEASHLGSPVSVLGTISSIPLIPLFSRSPGIE